MREKQQQSGSQSPKPTSNKVAFGWTLRKNLCFVVR